MIHHTLTKTALRLEMRGRRKGLLRDQPEADWMAAEHLDRLIAACPPGADTCAIYKALGAELDPLPLGEALMRRGWRLALPFVEALDAPLSFRQWSPGDPMGRDASDLPAPLDSAPKVRPNLIITPLLAFDLNGGRLGQGGGFYDRTFAALAAAGDPPVCVGFGYAGQRLDHIPIEPHDRLLDGILTEAGYTEVRKEP